MSALSGDKPSLASLTHAFLYMARNRKSGTRPSDVPSGNDAPLLDIPESEQWRIIRESGILKQIPKEGQAAGATQGGADEEPEGLSPFAEEVFNAIMLIIPMSFMLLLMEMYVILSNMFRVQGKIHLFRPATVLCTTSMGESHNLERSWTECFPACLVRQLCLTCLP